MADQIENDGDDTRMRRIVGGRASRLEVYGLAVLLFIVTAGGLSGAMVIASNAGDVAAPPAAIDTSTTTASTESTTTTEPAPEPTTPRPTYVPAPTGPGFSQEELDALQAEAQRLMAEKAAHDAWVASVSIDGCPPGPYDQIYRNYNGGIFKPENSVPGVRVGSDLILLAVEISRVAHLGCYSIGLIGNGEPDGTWRIWWTMDDTVTTEQARQAAANLGYLR